MESRRDGGVEPWRASGVRRDRGEAIGWRPSSSSAEKEHKVRGSGFASHQGGRGREAAVPGLGLGVEDGVRARR